MSGPEWDLVVVGGGIHGAGVLQAAAAAGHRALLLEKDELGHGTSSRSSKLIHGGLRYLETFQLGLVRESLAEREVLLRIAPGLVRLIPFFVPVYRDTRRRPWEIRVGLALYALLGGLRPHARFATVPRARWDGLDGLSRDRLQAVFRYWDAQTDDARLTRAVARSAERLGARVALRSPLVAAQRLGDGGTEIRSGGSRPGEGAGSALQSAPRSADRSAGRSTDGPAGYRVVYRHDGVERETTTRALVNAAGPWVDRVLDLVAPPPPRRPIDLVQGTHIVVEGGLERGVYYAEAPADGRAVFVMPWHLAHPAAGEAERDAILVGTTETPFTGDPERVHPQPAEIDYLEQTLHHYFPGHRGRVLDAFAGLRVLPAGEGPAFRRRRETLFAVDDPADPRLVTVYGGKLTGYRAAAARVLDRLRPTLPARPPLADTATLELPVD